MEADEVVASFCYGPGVQPDVLLAVQAMLQVQLLSQL